MSSLFLLTFCVCMFVCGLLIMLVHLETYIHESVNLSPWYPRSLPTIFLIVLISSGVGKNLMYECLVYFYCIFLHSYLMNGFWTQVCLDKRIDSYQYSLYLVLCSKWYRGSEDSMFVHIVFKCKNSKLCMNLGELPYFI